MRASALTLRFPVTVGGCCEKVTQHPQNKDNLQFLHAFQKGVKPGQRIPRTFSKECLNMNMDFMNMDFMSMDLTKAMGKLVSKAVMVRQLLLSLLALFKLFKNVKSEVYFSHSPYPCFPKPRRGHQGSSPHFCSKNPSKPGREAGLGSPRQGAP